MAAVAIKAFPRPDAAESHVGVIDIGSNSVRLVVFERLAQWPLSLYNEKVLCGLARDLHDSGRLNEAGVELAIQTLHRFVALTRAMEIDRLDVLATAAVRDAVDGPEFIRRVQHELGLAVQVISGQEEARLVGLSVITSFPDANGVVGDLGGGSLELVEVRDGRLGRQATLPIGALRLMRNGLPQRGELVAEIDKALGGVKWLASLAGRNFYPVGGAWRALARLDIAQRDYPLRVVDHYAMTRPQAEALLEVVERMGPNSLQKVKVIGSRRLETLPVASYVLARLLAIGRPVRLVFSGGGLREGYLVSLLSEKQRAADPLLASCRELAARSGRFGVIGDELFAWTSPLFGDEPAGDRRLRRAACLMADISWRDHPDYRAHNALHSALQLSMPGIDHAGRCWLALALYYRYGASARGDMPSLPASLLDTAEAERATRLGLSLRAGMSLSGGAPGLLPRTRLSRRKKTLALTYDAAVADLIREPVEKRLRTLAQFMGLTPKLASRG